MHVKRVRYVGDKNNPGQIYKKLCDSKNNHRVVLQGCQGMGKSHIAKAYGREFEDKYSFLYLIKANSFSLPDCLSSYQKSKESSGIQV